MISPDVFPVFSRRMKAKAREKNTEEMRDLKPMISPDVLQVLFRRKKPKASARMDLKPTSKLKAQRQQYTH